MTLDAIEQCYDAIPRGASNTEEVGPFTLFIAAEGTGWQYYARPRLGLSDEISTDDVRRLVERQWELGVPRSIEWVGEVTPSLLPAVRAALRDAEVEECPLLAVPTGSTREGRSMPGDAGRCTLLTPNHPDLPLVVGAVDCAFGQGETVEPRNVGSRPALLESGALVMVAAYDANGNVVGGGSAAPRGSAAELMGIGVVGSARGQGHGTAITRSLVDAVRDLGVQTAFLSAASDEAASIYRSVGFERVGLALVLEVDHG
jgi:ribosomal protein S18 acetylase RimI-like enzyme